MHRSNIHSRVVKQLKEDEKHLHLLRTAVKKGSFLDERTGEGEIYRGDVKKRSR